VTEVRMNLSSVEELLGVVTELRAEGLTQGPEFSFAYYIVEQSYSWEKERYVIFTFANDSLATWFTLKWVK
jgi:hypothetical protein